jgi:hypothetical protein
MRRLFAAILIALLASGAAPAVAGWVALPNAPTAPTRFDDVFFVSPDSGWVVDGAGRIHRTTNGGQSWTLQASLPTYLRCVGFATRFKGWAGSLYGPPLLYATSNAGVTWTPVLNIPDPQPSGICGLSVVNVKVLGKSYACQLYDGRTTGGVDLLFLGNAELFAEQLVLGVALLGGGLARLARA